MSYVDGFVIAVPKKKVAEYLKMARWGKKLWLKHGAIGYKECVGDDLAVPYGTPFPKMMKLKAGETVIFSYIEFRSRSHRDQVNARVMKEIEKSKTPPQMPFDIMRMAYGGFQARVE